MEQRNNKRLLLGEAIEGVEAPGERVEVDSVEVDLSLVAVNSGSTSQSVGRVVVYAMRDVLTHAVVAISVGFENNSFLGLTNLFLNLGEDKVEYCRRFGIELKDPSLWPSEFLPHDLYADRGSDYKSDPMGMLCNRLKIIRHLVPGGSGSLKGTIESWFHQMHSMINPYTEGVGQITKRFDSEHHIISELKRNPSSRRAVMLVRDKEKDMENADPACLQHIQYFIRKGKLDCMVLFRSNDACKAAFMNAFALIRLQEKVAKEIGVEVGTYTHRASSFHCYAKDFTMLEGYVKRIRKAMEDGDMDEVTFDYHEDWDELMEAEIPRIMADAKRMREEAEARKA